jgi:hypothetical protein
MTVGASAITIFHPPSDPERFGHRVAGLLAAASNTRGYVSARRSVQRDGHWTVEVPLNAQTCSTRGSTAVVVVAYAALLALFAFLG